MKAELDQICEGLHIGGLIWNDEKAGSLMGLFGDEGPAKLTAVQVSALFLPALSEEGSSRDNMEEEMALHRGYFLCDVERGLWITKGIPSH